MDGAGLPYVISFTVITYVYDYLILVNLITFVMTGERYNSRSFVSRYQRELETW